MQEQVYFYSDGLKLSGTLNIPDDYRKGEKRPTIVCVHGYGGRPDVYLVPFAREFMANGYVALFFYHRGFGDSEGVRTRNIPMEQVRDIRHAITYVEQRPEVDPDKIGLFGVSFGGATVLYAAAIDPRARCVVEVGGLGDGERWAKSKRTHWQWMQFMDEMKEDRIRRVLTGQSKRMPYLELNPTGPGMTKILNANIKLGEKYPEGYPMENVDEALSFRVEPIVHLISPRATLFVHSERDEMVPVDEARILYAKAGEHKRLVIIPGVNHAEVYEPVNPEIFKIPRRESLEWFGTYLK